MYQGTTAAPFPSFSCDFVLDNAMIAKAGVV